MQPVIPGNLAPSWDQRLYPGLRVPTVPAETRAALVQAAGALGVEAEHFLNTVRAFLAPTAGAKRSREVGEMFLWQLEASATRLRPTAESFELATQSYLTALDESDPDRRAGVGTAKTSAEPWWSAEPDALAELGSLDLCLRQCGFSYRHAVAAGITPGVEALAEQLGLLLHALDTLPPVGVLPVPALYAGLYELASTFQGHVVPHLLADDGSGGPGLPAAIRHLRALDATDDRSLTADLDWARAQLQEVRQLARQQRADQHTPPARSGFLAGLLRRKAAPASSPPSSPEAWLAMAERDWQATIAAMEALASR